ncbi:MAG: DnaJ family domain-containing protein [Desulfurivibrionaceae bacterium]
MRIAEQRISKAIDDGTLDFSRWKDKPLPKDDDSSVPPELRMAYKVLKNAGYLPPELEDKKEVKRLEELINRTDDEHVKVKQMRKLSVLLAKIEARRGRPVNIELQDDYHSRVVDRVSLNSVEK